jgi:hypothetical protein
MRQWNKDSMAGDAHADPQVRRRVSSATIVPFEALWSKLGSDQFQSERTTRYFRVSSSLDRLSKTVFY